MNAPSAVVVVGSHAGRRHIVVLLDGGLGQQELDEHRVDLVLELLEQLAPVDLQAGVLEDCVQICRMWAGNKAGCRASPFVVPLLPLEGLGHLPLVLVFALAISRTERLVFSWVAKIVEFSSLFESILDNSQTFAEVIGIFIGFPESFNVIASVDLELQVVGVLAVLRVQVDLMLLLSPCP